MNMKAAGQKAIQGTTVVQTIRSTRKQEEERVVNPDFFDAIGKGDTYSVEHHLGMQDDPMDLLRSKDPQGLTPLRKAVVLNKTEICRLLIDYGAEPSLVDPLGKTVLHRAASVGSRDLMAPLLVSPDSSVNSQDKKGNTPLHYAVQGQHRDAVDWLLFLGADVNRKNNDEKSPIDIAPPDLLPLLKKRVRDLKVEPVELASSFVAQKYMHKLGAVGDVLLVTSDDWPTTKQFLLSTRRRAAYSQPPVPLRQDEFYYTDTLHYRLMYTLPANKTRVKVHFSVFEELTESELIMKITSKDNFLGEVPLEMSTYIVNDYTNYIFCGDLNLMNQGTFVLVKRPKWVKLVKDEEGVFHNPDLEGFLLTCPGELPHWPENFQELRMESERNKKDAMMAPLLAALEEKNKETFPVTPAKSETANEQASAEYKGTDEGDENKNNNDNKNNKNPKSASPIKKDNSSTTKNMKNKKSVMPDENALSRLSKISLMEEEEDAPPELLYGNEPDTCEDFYYISRGWGLYVQMRQTIKSQILLDIFEPEEAPATLLRTNTLFYTLQHASEEATCEEPFLLQIPKLPDKQNPPFAKVGTVLVYVRKALAPDEEEFPDPDESQEESFIAEDGKSTKLQWWLAKEKERWSLLPSGISNNQTRVVFQANQFTTYVLVQLNVGTEKWIYDDPDEETVSERSGDSDASGDGEGGSDDDDDEPKEKKKKKKEDESAKDTEGQTNSEKSKGDKTANNKSSNNKSANNEAAINKSENNKPSRKDKGALLTAEPWAPAPSPQQSITAFKDRSENKTDIDSDFTDSEESQSESENDANNNARDNQSSNNSREESVEKAKSQTKSQRRGNQSSNNSKEESVEKAKSQTKSQRRGKKNVEDEPTKKSQTNTTNTIDDATKSDELFAHLEAEEMTVNMGMKTARSSFYSLEPRPPPADEDEIPIQEESLEDLPLITGAKSMRFPPNAILGEYEFGNALNTLTFEEIDIDSVLKEIALMWRYRNHFPVSACIFTRPRPNEELSWDLILEVVSSSDLVVRAENWLARGYALIARTKEFPLKSNRQLLITLASNLIIPGPGGCQPGGTKTINMWYVSNKVNFIEMVVKKYVEPKMGFGGKKAGGGGGRKKDEPKIKEPDLSLVIDAYYPGLVSVKEMALLTCFMDAEKLWHNEHLELRAPHDILISKLVQFMKETPEVTQIWWKVWIMLGYSETDMEREKSNQDAPESTAKITKQWFADNLDEYDAGILRVIHTLRCLKLPEEVLIDFIGHMKDYKGTYVLKKDTKQPRFHKLLFHWIKETKITVNHIFSIIETPILMPISDIFLLQLSQLVVGTPEEIGSAMEVEENYLYMLNEDESIQDISYKPFKIMTKARQKHDDVLKYFVLLLDMVKKTNQPRAVGDFAVAECHRWIETVADNKDYKDMCTKLENLLSTYVPNKGPSEELLARQSDPKIQPSKEHDGDTTTDDFTITTESM